MENRNDTDHQEWLVDELADPELAALYLTAALEDSPEMFLEAVKDVAQAKHKISEIAKQAGITRESIYRSFSSEGNPAFKTFHKLLDILDIGIQFTARVVKAETAAPIAPLIVDEINQLEVPVAAKPQGILTAYFGERGFNAEGYRSLQVFVAGDTQLNIASPTQAESNTTDESMSIPAQVLNDALMWEQQQLLVTEEKYA